jgi:hypothetical protein
MESSETINKTCLICKLIKEETEFVIGRNKCKSCRNEQIRNDYANLEINVNEQKCNTCQNIKPIIEFYKGRKICINCDNVKRRNKYATDEVYKKRVNRATIKCKKGKPLSDLEQIAKTARSSICRYLTTKTKRTMEYLGCSREEYIKWLGYNDNNYTLENHGKIWHIDHVIPLSRFDITNEDNKMIAFNWRNTMALSAQENLKKNNKILPQQITEHLQRLTKYHIENNIKLPQEYINLFAKHLVDGNTLKLLLPL